MANAKEASDEAQNWFRTSFNPEVQVQSVGRPDAGDVDHLTRGISVSFFFAFVKVLFQGLSASDTSNNRAPGRAPPDWYVGQFPDHPKSCLKLHLCGYELVDDIRKWLKEQDWRSFSVIEVLLAMSCPGVGLAQAFLSHSQAETYLQTMNAMRESCKMLTNGALGMYFFLDYVCIRQCLAGDFSPATVHTVIQAIHHTVLVITPRTAPWALSRAWCVFEVVHTLLTESELVVFPVLEYHETHDIVENLWRGVRQSLLDQQVQVKMEDCKAKDDSDKVRIIAEMESSIGVGVANEKVTLAMKSGMESFVEFVDKYRKDNNCIK